VAAVNGLLRRARERLSAGYPAAEPARSPGAALRAVLERYVEAWENGDVDGLVALLSEQVVLTMPPSPTWYAGRPAVRVHAARMFAGQAQGRWRLRATRANQQMAFAGYKRDEATGRYRAHMLQLLTLTGTTVTQLDMFFLPELFGRFGLPGELGPGD
jgi:RNA polymerase sigma-70 factor (ECF subfamily)